MSPGKQLFSSFITTALDTRRWIQVERLRLVFANLPIALALSFLTACFMAAVLLQVQPAWHLAVWLAIAGLIALWRYRDTRCFRKLHEDVIDIEQWRTRVDVGTATSGIWWGFGSVYLFPDDLVHQVYIAFILAGVGAAAMTSYAAMRRTYLSYLIPSIAPMTIRFAMVPNEVHISMALLIVLFLVVVVRSAIHTERMIANVLELRAENIDLTRALHHEATHDALVDLVNYREFHNRLTQVATQSARDHQPYALLFVDLDHFKEINDTAGHAAGDEMLRRIGLLLRAQIRTTDTAARMGGDEFAVLLPNCPRRHAEEIAGNIMASVRDLALQWEGKTFHVGTSIGVAYTNAGEFDTATILKAADSACYAAKRSGRNRIEIYHADPSYETSGRFNLHHMNSG